MLITQKRLGISKPRQDSRPTKLRSVARDFSYALAVTCGALASMLAGIWLLLWDARAWETYPGVRIIMEKSKYPIGALVIAAVLCYLIADSIVPPAIAYRRDRGGRR